jgi:hypothetical protein
MRVFIFLQRLWLCELNAHSLSFDITPRPITAHTDLLFELAKGKEER